MLSPVVEPLAGVTTTGAAGGVVSTVKVFVLDAGPVLPTGSVAVARTVCAPSASAVVGVKLQAPEALAVVVPRADTEPTAALADAFRKER